MKYVLLYLAAISLVSAVVTISDKRRAKSGRRRCPEKVLLLLSALGGSGAMLITMKIIRHKTQKPKFMVGIPIIILLQLTAAALACYYDTFGLTGL